MKRLFARITQDSQAVTETCLCEEHNNKENQSQLHEKLDPQGRRHLQGDYVEVTADAESKCQVCGAQGPRSQGGQYICGVIGEMPKLPSDWSGLKSYAEAIDEWSSDSHERLVAAINRSESVFDMIDSLIQAAQSKPQIWNDKDVGGKLQALALFLMRT